MQVQRTNHDFNSMKYTDGSLLDTEEWFDHFRIIHEMYIKN